MQTLTKPINPIRYSSNTLLGQIVQKAKQLQTLEQQMRAHLAADLAKHCKVANYHHGCLVIETDSAVWATRLRYSTPDLLTSLRQEEKLYQLRSIRHYVRPKVPLAFEQSKPCDAHKTHEISYRPLREILRKLKC